MGAQAAQEETEVPYRDKGAGPNGKPSCGKTGPAGKNALQAAALHGILAVDAVAAMPGNP